MRHDEQMPVCNLTVQDLHTFAVGQEQVLVHNTSGTGGGGGEPPQKPQLYDPDNFFGQGGSFPKPADVSPQSLGYTWNSWSGEWIPPSGSDLPVLGPDGLLKPF
jgi:hypothetical protein